MSDLQNKGIHLVYKKVGETPLACLERFRKEHPALHGEPMTYAGRLDPMAEGLLVMLVGDAVHDKEKFLDLPKTYQCQILWQMETDTLDVLGMVTESGGGVPTVQMVTEILQKQIGVFEQKYPAFSSKPVAGKPLFAWAREGRLGEITIPTHEVELYSAIHIKRVEITGRELLQNIQSKINLVVGDFRQKNITELWQTTLSQNPEETCVLDTVELSVSSGFYVRQFVQDIAHICDTHALAYSILRTQVGKYCLESVDDAEY